MKYTDEPCLASKKVDITPTRRLDKDGGQQRTRTDVRNERTQEQLGEILRPITGLTPEQRDTLHRRSKLTAAAKRECATLDERIEGLETQVLISIATNLLIIEKALLTDRMQHRNLGC